MDGKSSSVHEGEVVVLEATKKCTRSEMGNKAAYMIALGHGLHGESGARMNRRERTPCPRALACFQAASLRPSPGLQFANRLSGARGGIPARPRGSRAAALYFTGRRHPRATAVDAGNNNINAEDLPALYLSQPSPSASYVFDTAP